MKIADLSKIDIKDIDVAKLKDQILAHKDIALQIIIGLIAFLLAVSMFNQSQVEIKGHKTQINTLQAKTGAIEQYNNTQSEIKSFISKVPQSVSEDKMINLVTDFAGNNGVKIVTFSQANIEKNNSIALTTIKFTLVSESFVSLVRFLSDIERGADFMQILSCDIEPQQNSRVTSKDSKQISINFRLEVASIKVE